MIAMLIREFLEFYRMDYSLAVYLPEVALNENAAPSREELHKKLELP